MITQKALPRRTFLRGVGTAVALPFLDAMVPGAGAPRRVEAAGAHGVRLCAERHHHGRLESGLRGQARRAAAHPEAARAVTARTSLLLGNLTHNTGRALLDGAGDHGRCCASYLTGMQLRKTLIDIKAGISFDQIVAKQVGKQTRFPSLELGMEDARQAGDCDSGYSCAYTNNLAWRARRSPCRRCSIRARCSSGCSATASR